MHVPVDADPQRRCGSFEAEKEKKKNLTQKRNFNGGQDSKDVHSLIIP